LGGRCPYDRRCERVSRHPASDGYTSSDACTGNPEDGDAIELSVECERFDEVVAEGG
jgi:hypothetical protein